MRDLIFLLVIYIFSLLAFLFPELFIPLERFILPLLALVMLSMGITLTPRDFLEILKRPYIVLYGAFLQFTIMPLSAYALGVAFNLPPQLFLGVVLVGSAPGGTASNLITYLSKGDLPYSISMTTLSTLLSPLLTPLWTYILAGKYVEVPFLAMVKTTAYIVVLPVILGMLIRHFLKFPVEKLDAVLPYAAVISISLIIATIFALNAEVIKEVSFLVVFVVLIHNLLGFILGYAFGMLAGLDKTKAKTLSIEVGIQNSGLSAVLAIKYFSKIAAIPSAIFSLSQNLLGVILSVFFRRL